MEELNNLETALQPKLINMNENNIQVNPKELIIFEKEIIEPLEKQKIQENNEFENLMIPS